MAEITFLANLIAGFKTKGICPLNHKALKVVPYCSGSSNSNEEVVDSIAANSNEIFKNTPIQGESGQQTTNESVHSKNVSIEEEEDENLSSEEESLYNRRFEEGYNLSIDPSYIHSYYYQVRRLILAVLTLHWILFWMLLETLIQTF